MTINIEYSDYPDIIATITITTSITENMVITLIDANNIKIQSNDSNSGDVVENDMSKEELLDLIKVLQEMTLQMT